MMTKPHLIIHVAKNPLTGVWASMRGLMEAQACLPNCNVKVFLALKESWPSEYSDQLRALDCEYSKISIASFPLSYIALIWSSGLKSFVAKSIQEQEYAKVTLHFHNADFSAVFMRNWIREIDVKPVVTYHGMPGIDPRFSLRRPWQKFLHQWLKKFDSKLVSCETMGPLAAEEILGYRASEFQFVPNGVKCNPYASPDDIPVSERELSLAFLGSIDANKGWELIVQAVKLANSRGVNVKLVIAGNGIEVKKLQDMISGSHDCISYIGSVDNGRETVIRKCDALILASRNEGLPMVFLEALSEARGIISTEVAGSIELRKAGVHIFTITRDVNVICKEITALSKNISFLRITCSENLKCFLNNFEIESTSERYMEVYES